MQLFVAASTSSGLLWPSAGGFQPCSRGDRREGAPVTYGVPPPPAHVHTAGEPPSHAEATHRARCPPLLLLLLWGRHRGGSGRGDSCRQWLPAMKPHHGTSALSTGLPNAETLPKRVMNSVETNKLADSQLEILIFKQHLTIPGKRHTEMY